MVTRKTTAGQAKGKKLKLKKETLTDLDAKANVKGGAGAGTRILCTAGCVSEGCRTKP